LGPLFKAPIARNVFCDGRKLRSNFREFFLRETYADIGIIVSGIIPADAIIFL